MSKGSNDYKVSSSVSISIMAYFLGIDIGKILQVKSPPRRCAEYGCLLHHKGHPALVNYYTLYLARVAQGNAKHKYEDHYRVLPPVTTSIRTKLTKSVDAQNVCQNTYPSWKPMKRRLFSGEATWFRSIIERMTSRRPQNHQHLGNFLKWSFMSLIVFKFILSAVLVPLRIPSWGSYFPDPGFSLKTLASCISYSFDSKSLRLCWLRSCSLDRLIWWFWSKPALSSTLN